MVAMRCALVEWGRWNEVLIMTYAEFGRRPRENESNGTDHGTVAPHFVIGGRVNGGLAGQPGEDLLIDFQEIVLVVENENLLACDHVVCAPAAMGWRPFRAGQSPRHGPGGGPLARDDGRRGTTRS